MSWTINLQAQAIKQVGALETRMRFALQTRVQEAPDELTQAYDAGLGHPLTAHGHLGDPGWRDLLLVLFLEPIQDAKKPRELGDPVAADLDSPAFATFASIIPIGLRQRNLVVEELLEVVDIGMQAFHAVITAAVSIMTTTSSMTRTVAASRCLGISAVATIFGSFTPSSAQCPKIALSAIELGLDHLEPRVEFIHMTAMPWVMCSMRLGRSGRSGSRRSGSWRSVLPDERLDHLDGVLEALEPPEKEIDILTMAKRPTSATSRWHLHCMETLEELTQDGSLPSLVG